MDLFQCHERKIFRADRCLQSAAILQNIFLRVPFRKAEIQQFFAIDGARAARARAESVNQPSQFRKRSQLQNLKAAGFAQHPGRGNLRTRQGGLRRLTVAAPAKRCFSAAHNQDSIIATAGSAEMANVAQRIAAALKGNHDCRHGH